MTEISRRQLVKTGAFLSSIPLAPLVSSAKASAIASDKTDPWQGLSVGVATYSLRKMPIEMVIEVVKRLDLKYVSIKNIENHIDFSHSTEERKKRVQIFEMLV